MQYKKIFQVHHKVYFVFIACLIVHICTYIILFYIHVQYTSQYTYINYRYFSTSYPARQYIILIGIDTHISLYQCVIPVKCSLLLKNVYTLILEFQKATNVLMKIQQSRHDYEFSLSVICGFNMELQIFLYTLQIIVKHVTLYTL